jgi:hypothetical protein
MKSQPFLFDANIFDDDTPLSEEERAKLPEFSREEMKAARLKAFEEGKEEGLQESLDSINNTTLILLQKIERDLGILFSSEVKRQKEYEQSATHLAAEIFTKAFPIYMEAHGLNELHGAVVEALSAQMVPEIIQIEVSDTVFIPFTKLIGEHTENLQKQITFKADSALPEYACRISWAGGGLLCDRNALGEKIFNILNHSLAERGFSLHDVVDGKENSAGEGKAKADETGDSMEEYAGDGALSEEKTQSLAAKTGSLGETTTSGES